MQTALLYDPSLVLGRLEFSTRKTHDANFRAKSKTHRTTEMSMRSPSRSAKENVEIGNIKCFAGTEIMQYVHAWLNCTTSLAQCWHVCSSCASDLRNYTCCMWNSRSSDYFTCTSFLSRFMSLNQCTHAFSSSVNNLTYKKDQDHHARKQTPGKRHTTICDTENDSFVINTVTTSMVIAERRNLHGTKTIDLSET